MSSMKRRKANLTREEFMRREWEENARKMAVACAAKTFTGLGYTLRALERNGQPCWDITYPDTQETITAVGYQEFIEFSTLAAGWLV